MGLVDRPPPLSVMYGEEKATLRDILAGKEFTDYVKEDDGKSQNLLLYWLQKLLEALQKLFPNIEMASGSERTFSWILIAVGGLALAALAAALIRMIRVERRLGKRRTAVLHPDELEQAPVDLLARARQAAAAGEMREATRLVFLTLLVRLQERELLRIAPWKTNWEYADELSERGSAWERLFRESSLLFDTVWYGGKTLEEAAFRTWADQVEASLTDRSSGGGAA